MPSQMQRTGKMKHVPVEVVALISAMRLTEPDLEPLAQLSDKKWVSLLEFCDIAHLTLSLAQLPMTGFPRWVVERLQTNLADNALRFEQLKKTYREAADALDRAGVEYIVIKGFTQAPDYVKDPRLRLQSDIDLCCPQQHIPAAQTALQAIGYVPDDTADSTNADHVRTMVRLGDCQWRGNFYDPQMPFGIELHFCLWNERISRVHIPEVESFWERRTEREVAGLSFPCLSPIDHLGYLALHLLRNLFLRDWIVHHVYELAVFLHSRADDGSFWRNWSETHSSSLRSKEAIAFYHARAWFACRIHPEVEHVIAALPARQSEWLQRFSNSALENMFRENKDALWLQISLLSSNQDRRRVLRRTLI